MSPSTISAKEAEAIRRRYLAVDTCNVADVLDDLGYRHQGLAPGFVPLPADAGKMAGWAHTIRGEHVEYPVSEKDPAKMAACAELGPGSISVWAGAGEGICFFGELIAIGMQERGCVGALADGGVRDLRWIGERRFPVYARYRSPVQSIGRWKVVESGEPVTLPGADGPVTIAAGDFILADEDGVIAIPAALAVEVLERAEKLGASEVEIRRELSRGLSLAEALEKFGHV